MLKTLYITAKLSSGQSLNTRVVWHSSLTKDQTQPHCPSNIPYHSIERVEHLNYRRCEINVANNADLCSSK